MAVGDAYVFPGFLTQVLTQLFFPKPPTTFLTCFCRDERQKYAGKEVCLNQGSHSQPPGHESDTLATESPVQSKIFCKFEENGRKFSKRVENTVGKGEIAYYEQSPLFHSVFKRFVLQTRENKGLFGKGL